MTSGLDTLTSIDQAVRQVRHDIQQLDQEIQTAGAELMQVSQDRAKHFRELAALRLNQFTSGEFLSRLDDADRRVTELLRERTEVLQTLQKQIEASDHRQSALEAERTAQQERVHTASEALDHGEAATQKRLATEPAYQEQLKKAQQSDRVATQAEEKAQQSEKDRADKGQHFEADPLFTYLWERGFGTAKYSANPLIRMLDGWVAKLCRYHDARPNYTMLLEIPKRLREHSERVRAEANREFATLRTLEEQAAAADGVPALRESLQREEQRAQEIDAAIQAEEARYSELIKQRSEFAGGKDEYSRQCLEVLVDQFQREPLAQLRREAEETTTAEDNVLVQQLADLEYSRQRLESLVTEHKQLHLRHLKRLEELEQVRWNFKQRRYDDIHSTFPNGVLIGTMLNEFLRGMASSGQLWGTIENQHRRRRIEADSGFGSGGFGHPSGGAWHFPIPTPRGGGGRSMGSGGGFRTGGSF